MFSLNSITILTSFLSYNVVTVDSRSGGLMVLYQPLDITLDCASSIHLRYDLTFGMGMSDTITTIQNNDYKCKVEVTSDKINHLIVAIKFPTTIGFNCERNPEAFKTLRTIQNNDYECEVDVTSDKINHLIVAIKFPTTIGFNCERNPEAFKVMKYGYCYSVCNKESLDQQDVFSRHWVLYTRGRFRFQFRSNSSINVDIGAYQYEVTVTTARLQGKGEERGCYMMNETECFYNDNYYCITSGVVCDGINNCGIDEWYDERRSDCNLSLERMGFAPILGVVALFVYVTLTCAHILRRCLPKGTSYFIYNINEDNRLRTDPIMVPRAIEGLDSEYIFSKRISTIPIPHDSSEGEEDEEKVAEWTPGSSQEEIPEHALWGPLPRIKLSVPQRLSRHFKTIIGYNPRDLKEQLGVTVRTGGLDWRLKDKEHARHK